MVVTHRADVTTRGQGDAHDLTDIVSSAVGRSGCAAGTATVFVVGSTAAVTTIEFEPGAIADFNRVLEAEAESGAAMDADVPQPPEADETTEGQPS